MSTRQCHTFSLLKPKYAAYMKTKSNSEVIEMETFSAIQIVVMMFFIQTRSAEEFGGYGGLLLVLCWLLIPEM